MPRLFGTDGVRGLANGDLTADLALGLAQAAAAVLTQGRSAEARRAAGKRPVAIVARDPRVSGYAVNFVRLTREQQLDVVSRSFFHGKI